MSSKLYEVQVLDIANTDVHLKISIIHPDERFIYEKKNFALQLIWDPADPNFTGPCPLNQAIPLPKIYDIEWVIGHQNKFINAVKITKQYKYPAQPEWDETSIPSVVMNVSVCDSSYLEHLKVGMKWQSAAYDMERYL